MAILEIHSGDSAELGLKKIQVRLGWTPKNRGPRPDLDVSIFLLGADGKIPEDEYFVFYNNLKSPDGAVVHTGDVRDQSSKSNDIEEIHVDFARLERRIRRLVFVVTIHKAEINKLTFGAVKDAVLEITNMDTGESMMKYELNEDFFIETAVTIGQFVLRGSAWWFEALGDGSRDGLKEFLEIYN